MLTTAGGLSLGLLANARRVGAMAVGGDLDAVLALPVAPLPFVLLRRIEPVNLGDLAFGIVLFAVVGHPTPSRALVFVLVVLASATLLTGFLVLTGALAFFSGRSESGELGFHAMLLLGAYPVDLFAGAIRVLLFTVVPAAFIVGRARSPHRRLRPRPGRRSGGGRQPSSPSPPPSPSPSGCVATPAAASGPAPEPAHPKKWNRRQSAPESGAFCRRLHRWRGSGSGRGERGRGGGGQGSRVLRISHFLALNSDSERPPRR